MLQYSRYTGMRRWEMVETQEDVHGLIERQKIHDRVWDRANNCLGRYRHERLEVGGGGQTHDLLNGVVILNTIQSCLDLKKHDGEDTLASNKNEYLQTVLRKHD